MLGTHFGEGIIGAIFGAFAAPFGGYAGYTQGKNITEIALQKIYEKDFDPKNQSLQARIITQGIGGGIGAILGGLFTAATVAYVAKEFLIWKSMRY